MHVGPWRVGIYSHLQPSSEVNAVSDQLGERHSQCVSTLSGEIGPDWTKLSSTTNIKCSLMPCPSFFFSFPSVTVCVQDLVAALKKSLLEDQDKKDKLSDLFFFFFWHCCRISPEAAASPSCFIMAASSLLAGSLDHARIAESPRMFRSFLFLFFYWGHQSKSSSLWSTLNTLAM